MKIMAEAGSSANGNECETKFAHGYYFVEMVATLKDRARDKKDAYRRVS